MKKFVIYILLLFFLINITSARADTVLFITQKGITLYNNGEYNEAIKYFNNAIRKDPLCKDAWAYRGLSLHSCKKYGEAIQSFNRALEIDPHHSIALKGKDKSSRALYGYMYIIKEDYINKILNTHKSLSPDEKAINNWLCFTAYIYISLCIMGIAHQTETKHRWMAWVPGFQCYLIFNIAGISFWYILLPTVLFYLLLSISPITGVVIIFPYMIIFTYLYYRLWSQIAGKCGESAFIMGLLMLIPGINGITLGYIARNGIIMLLKGNNPSKEKPSQVYRRLDDDY